MTATLHKAISTFMIISRSVLLRMRSVWTDVPQKIKKHILCSAIFFLSGRLRDNVEKYDSRRGQR